MKCFIFSSFTLHIIQRLSSYFHWFNDLMSTIPALMLNMTTGNSQAYKTEVDWEIYVKCKLFLKCLYILHGSPQTSHRTIPLVLPYILNQWLCKNFKVLYFWGNILAKLEIELPRHYSCLKVSEEEYLLLNHSLTNPFEEQPPLYQVF